LWLLRNGSAEGLQMVVELTKEKVKVKTKFCAGVEEARRIFFFLEKLMIFFSFSNFQESL